MITVTETITVFESFSKTLGYSPGNSLFFDIETTGFSPAASMVFLIGVIFHDGKDWRLTQYLAENPTEEEPVLRAFLDISEKFSTLIHFNGSTFDLPYLIHKADNFHIAHNLKAKHSLDLYRKYRPLKNILGLERMKQASLEAFLGWQRQDRLTGKHMVTLFQKYAASGEPGLKDLLLLHNHDDMLGMTHLLRLAAFLTLFDGQIAEILSAELIPQSSLHGAAEPSAAPNAEGNETQNNCGREPYPDNHWQFPDSHRQFSDSPRQFLEIRFRLPSPVPRPITLFQNYGLAVRADRGILTIPVFEGTLLHFFPDYRNYYYLPLEDQAIHKSVAAYVDKAYREPAKASNCYIKRRGIFLPQPQELFTPVFKSALDASGLYFSFTDELLNDPEHLKQYAVSILTAFR